MVGITVVKEDLETLFVRVQLTGLDTSIRYDVYRLQLRYMGKNEAGTRIYERQRPDTRALWSSVAHRVGWQPANSTATFRDFECPRRPTSYFVVESSKVGPFEYDFANGDYPISRGVLDDEVIHFSLDLREVLNAPVDVGHVLVRSTAELAHYAEACVVELDGPHYDARVNEHKVLGSQFPVIVSDSREARRGTVTLLTRDLGAYNDLRRIVFPESGRIRPIILQSGGDPAALLDDMRCVPLNIEVEQASPANADLRFIHIDFAEVDPSAPLLHRSGDNDALVNEPQAQFTISDTTPKVNQWVTLTDTSTGQGDSWEWTLAGGQNIDNRVGKWFTQGPHQVRWQVPGTKTIRLRFGGSGAGHHTRTKTVEVHP